MATAMKAGAPFAFTYHHNKLEAYHPIAVAILDAGFQCTDSLPCPAEMGASIHINGTGSSIIDTVFVCRKRDQAKRIVQSDLATRIGSDEEALRQAGVAVSAGDHRCILFGHFTRLAVQKLSSNWESTATTQHKLKLVADALGVITHSTPTLEVFDPTFAQALLF